MATIELRDLNPAEFDNNLIVYSKIGIGIDSPSYHLHIKETTTTNTYFFAENTTAGNAGIKLKNSQGEWTIIANDRLRFIDDDSGVERMSITSAGQFGS